MYVGLSVIHSAWDSFMNLKIISLGLCGQITGILQICSRRKSYSCPESPPDDDVILIPCDDGDGGIAGGFTIIRNEIDCFDYQYFPLPSSNFTHTSTFPTEQNRTNTVNISNRDGKLLVVVLSRQSDLSIYLLGGCRWSLNKQFSLQLGNRLLCWLYRRRHSIHAVNGCRKEVNAFDLHGSIQKLRAGTIRSWLCGRGFGVAARRIRDIDIWHW